jgi:osmoprotectant transport system substrate-binding protein
MDSAPGLLRGPRRLLLTLLALALLLASCAGGEDPFAADADEGAADETDTTADDTDAADGEAAGEAGEGGDITVAALGFDEAQIMAHLYAGVLEDAGFDVTVQDVENRELSAPALESGELDVVPEYAATAAEFYNLDENGPDAEQVASGDVDETVTALRELVEPRGLEVLEPAEAANQNAFIASQEYADELGISTLSELGETGESVVLAATEECPERPFCLQALTEGYGIDVTENLPLGFGSIQAKDAVVTGRAQLGLTGTTDGTLGDLGLVVLDDDRDLQLADNLVPLVRVDSPGASEQAVEALNSLSAELTTDDLAELNRQVAEDRDRPEDAARSWLVERGLIAG